VYKGETRDRVHEGRNWQFSEASEHTMIKVLDAY
jgi:hypothetical protein